MFVRDITIYTCFLTFYSHLYILKYSFFAQFKKKHQHLSNCLSKNINIQ